MTAAPRRPALLGSSGITRLSSCRSLAFLSGVVSGRRHKRGVCIPLPLAESLGNARGIPSPNLRDILTESSQNQPETSLK
eukprot:1195872-Prorocentrum_minimum.AAC.4